MMPKSVTAATVNYLRGGKWQNPVRNLRGRSFSSTILKREIPSSAPKERVDCVVIGAGVVGIAIARELSLKGRDVLVLDSAPTFGTATSSRNSEVIHAGIYYPSLSLKAKFCVRGREMMYKYCSEHNVPHKQIGKLIVAARDLEIPKLKNLFVKGTENGVKGLRLLEASEAMMLEPELQCATALFSPISGIVDSHSLMLSLLVCFSTFFVARCGQLRHAKCINYLQSDDWTMTGILLTIWVQGEAENNGATFAYNTTVLGGLIDGNQISLFVTGTQNLSNWNEREALHAELILVPKVVINSAGLAAVALAKRLMGSEHPSIPNAYYARGHYFSLSKTKAPPFRHLIYPIPENGGLGVHATLDLDGQVKFGPDVEWIGSVDDIAGFLNRFDYSVSPERAERFYQEIRKYYPTLKDGSLEPGYAGIRPKLSGPGQTPWDFVIQGKDVHGVPGLVNLFGIESPGLTASLAIAEHVTLMALQ